MRRNTTGCLPVTLPYIKKIIRREKSISRNVNQITAKLGILNYK